MIWKGSGTVVAFRGAALGTERAFQAKFPNHLDRLRLSSVRKRGLGEADGQAVGARIHVTLTRPAKEDRASKPDHVAKNLGADA